MAVLNIEEETRLFEEKLNNNYFYKDRSKNTEEDYAVDKESRDNHAVKDFLDSEYFGYIKNMR